VARAIAIDSTDPLSYFNRGDLAYSLGNKDLAIKDFNAIIRLKSGTFIDEIASGIVQLERGQNLKAIAHLDRAIELRIDSADAYKYRGIANHQQGKIVEARQD
jgi:tetratricopeptide (TPR) repeat protein